MSLRPGRLAALLFIAAAIVCAPVAAADPVLQGSADTVINDLKAEGYIVQINWVNGFDTEQLDVCRVTGVNIPGDSPESRTTAYVDVSCPNHPDEASGSFGVGIGIG